MILTSWRHIINGSAKSTNESKTYGDNSYRDIRYFPVWYWQVEHKASRVVLSIHMNTLCQPITGNHWFCLSCPNFRPKDSIFYREVTIKPNKTQFPRKVFEGCGCSQWHEISVFAWAVPTLWQKTQILLAGSQWNAINPTSLRKSWRIPDPQDFPIQFGFIAFYWDLSSKNWVFC